MAFYIDGSFLHDTMKEEAIEQFTQGWQTMKQL